MARSPWLERFRQGSFRGVPFKTDSHQFSGGRRVQAHEFPQRDEGNTEDLGLKLRSFTLELLVIGDDYFDQRDALMAALESKGPGELIHPYLGRMIVQAGEFTLSETVTEGRMARFSVKFTKAGDLKFPDASQDDTANTVTNADAVREKSKSAFETIFSIANQPAFVVQSAADSVNKAMDFMEDAVKKVTEPVANLTFAISNVKASINDLIKLPGELAARIQETFDTLLSEFENDPETSEKILGNFTDLSNEYEPVVTGTPSRDKESENQNAIVDFFNQEALSNQAKAAVEVDFSSVDASLLSRDAIIDALDLELQKDIDDDLFQSIKDLQTSLSRALPRVGVTEIVSFIPPATTPVIVIAHSIFEDLSKEAEIIDQNAIEHPGFAPGGVALEVTGGQ